MAVRVSDNWNDIISLPRQSTETTTSNGSNEGRLNDILAKIEIEQKIKEGAENLLQVFDARKSSSRSNTDLVKKQVESQLNAANAKIQLLQQQLNSIGLEGSSGIESGSSEWTNILSDSLDNPDGRRSRQDRQKNEHSQHSQQRDESPTWILGDILQSFGDPKQESVTVVEKSNDLVALLQKYPLLKYDLVGSQVGDKIRILLLHKKTEVIAAGYRVARNTITSLDSIKNLRSLYLDLFIIRSLARDYKYQLERLQALRLVRAFLDIPNGITEVSRGIVRAIVAIAEQTDDKLRNVAIETLAEIFVQGPELVYQSGGFKILLQSIVDGPYELSYPIAMVLAYVLDKPENFRLFHGGRDLNYIISAFTDSQMRDHLNPERIQSSAKALSYLLKTWPGLQAFSADDFYSIKALISCLEYHVPIVRDAVLDVCFDIFNIKPHSWFSSFLNGHKITAISPTTKDTGMKKNSQSRYGNHYTALLLLIFLKCGLVDKLIKVIQINDDTSSSRKAILLLGELVATSSVLLPLQCTQNLTALPSLLKSAVSYTSDTDSAASTAVFQIDEVSRILHKRSNTLKLHNDIFLRSSMDSNTNAGTLTSHVRQKMGVQIDDASFKQLIMDTQVLNTKTYTKWNWDALLELIQGPLLNPKRLDEAIKTSKFMKRLLSFYRPFKYRFSSIKRTKMNQKYVKVGCELLETFLSCPEGVRYLSENKLLRQIAECLAQLDPMSGIVSHEPLFSSQRLQNTLSYGYFELLGTLSANPHGIAMMERWRMFNMFYHLTELNSRKDLIRYFIASMDYNLESHPRIIVSKALVSAPSDIRRFATSHLRNLVNATAETQKWAIGLLFIQLYDPDLEVCKLAVEVLEILCTDPLNLEHFVKLQPSLTHLGEVGTPLLLRFLSTSNGFKYLQELDYINIEMDNWFHGENENYVKNIAEYLEATNCLSIEKVRNGYNNLTTTTTATAAAMSSINSENEFTVTHPPRHFYGEITRTDEGCRILRSKRHFETFVETIDEFKDETADQELILKLEGCLWAVGHAASNDLGAPFLEDSNVVENIVHIAENSTLLSLKGTAYFVLGLISSTFEGAEILDEYGWSSVRTSQGVPMGICIPKDVASLIHPIEYSDLNAASLFSESKIASNDSDGGSVITEEFDEETEFPVVHSDPNKRKIISALSDLSNQILANDASKALMKIEIKHPSMFQTVDLYIEAMSLLERYRYKQLVRRYIFELFDTNTIMEKLTKKQKESQRKARHSSDSARPAAPGKDEPDTLGQ